MKFSNVLAAAVVVGVCSIATAETQEIRVPLRDGKLSLPELSAALSTKLGLPAIEYGTASVDVQGLGSSLVVTALNKALGGGCQVTVVREAVVVTYDTAKLPHSIDETKLAVRTFTATAAPEATAKQAEKLGLLLPTNVRADDRMVILLHGVDCTRDSLEPLAKLLQADGRQVAYFGYPDDQSLVDSSKLFTEQLTAYRTQFPKSPIDVVAFSMGGLVARATVEGDQYPGGVERLILLATPNHGSKWAHVRILTEIREQWQLWRSDKDYSPSWMITDGLGEAGKDLLPDSKFLTALNQHPRRAGVKYTIVNGNVHPVWQAAGNVTSSVASWIGPTAASWTYTDVLAAKLQNHRSESDGPVSQESTRLDGVTDVVTVAADHNALFMPHDGQDPAAWPTIKDRLK